MNETQIYSLDDLLYLRRSVRKFKKDLITMDKQMKLTKAARQAPSAGAIRPISIYNIENPDGQGAIVQSIWKACLKQKVILQAKMLMIFCVDFPKIQKRYGQRGNRYAILEVGHMAQNVCLKAIELGLATCCIGAFKDEKIKTILNCDQNPVYIVAIGYPE